MKKSNNGAGYGRIVNIASVAGKEGNPNASAYSASKAAVMGLTKSLGKELAQTEIKVNCITPAAVKTGMFSQMTQQHIDFMLSKIPMNRFGEIQEIANLVAWLSSDECSFSTGAVFDISGGRARLIVAKTYWHTLPNCLNMQVLNNASRKSLPILCCKATCLVMIRMGLRCCLAI